MPDPADDLELRWQRVATLSPSPLADMAADLLRRHGLRVWLRALPEGLHEGLSFSVGSEILVLAPDVDEATGVLADHFGDAFLSSQPSADDC